MTGASATYNRDGLATVHNADFMADPRFIEAYGVGMENAPANTRVEWRVHVALWCASQAIRLRADFAECGVNTGIISGAVMQWLKFSAESERKFYLFDTWAGIPLDQISGAEIEAGVARMNRKYENGDARYADVVRKFARWPNAVIVRGRIPESLAAMPADARLAWISIDLNVAAAEMAAIDVLWPRLVQGGMVLLDDYGWAAHVNQKKAWDRWAVRTGQMILSLPTGQGLIIK